MSTDGGYGWVVVGISFIYIFVAYGVPLSFGVLVPTIMEEFNCSKAAAVNVASMTYGFCHLVAVIVNSLIDKIGCQKGLFFHHKSLIQ